MRLVWVALACGFATLTTLTGGSAAAGPSHVLRLRPSGTAAQQLIDAGLSSSPTFRIATLAPMRAAIGGTSPTSTRNRWSSRRRVTCLTARASAMARAARSIGLVT